MDLSHLYVINYVVLSGMLLVFTAVTRNSQLQQRVRRNFYYLLAMELLELVVYDAELVLAAGTHFSMWRVFFSAVGYTVRPMMIVVIMHILADYSFIKPIRTLLATLLIFNTIMAFSAFFMDIAYSYTPTNNFRRGPLGYTFYAVAVVCMAAVMAAAIEDWRKNGAEMGMVILGCISVVIGMVAEMFYSFLGISRPAFMFGMVFLYVHFQLRDNQNYYNLLQNKARMDGLTGVLNRAAYIEDMQALSRKTDSGAAIVFADVNGLKRINDNFGHEAGDALLLRAAAFLNSHARAGKDRVYRVGGDEFVMILSDIRKEEFQTGLQSMKDALRDDWVVSCGGVWLNGVEDVDYATRIAEGAMYQNKADYYAAHPEFDRRLQRQKNDG